MSYAEMVTADRRLALLRILKEAPGYSANDSVLHTALESIGHKASRDTVRADMTWLDEQELVRLESMPVPGGREILVAAMRERGLDVATGRARHPGVKTPAPGI